MTHRRTAIVAVLFVYVAVRLFWWADAQHASATFRLLAGTGLLKIALWVVPAIALVMLVRRSGVREAVAALGLDAAIPRGITFGFLATVPLAVAAAFAPPARVDPVVLVSAAVIGPFAEEVLFRGFLLRQLIDRARWNAAVAIAVSAIAFGAAHVSDADVKVFWIAYQFGFGPDRILEIVGFANVQPLAVAAEIATMAAGGAVFGWITYRFNSLWPAIVFHSCVNMWITFAYGENPGPAFGAGSAAQVASFVLALLLTLRRPALVTSPSPVRLS